MDRKHFYFILGIIFLSLSITFFCQKEALFNQYVIQDDANEYIFPFYKINDPQLFKGDIFTEYSLRYNTKGTVLIYSIFSTFLDPLIFSKILPFILCCLSAICFFLIGKKIKNIYAGFLAAVIFIMHSWTFPCFSGGHAKAFSFLLLSAFIWFLLERRLVMLAVMLFLQIFIYPPIAVISAFSLCIISLLRHIKRTPHARVIDAETYFYLFIVVVCGVILYFLYWQPDDFLGPLFNLKDILGMPEFHMGGRDPHFIDSIKALRDESVAENIIGIPIYSLPTWILLGISCLGWILILRKKIRIASALNIFCVASFLLFLLSWVMLFYLFSPGRYLKFTFTVYLVFLSALTLYHIGIERFREKGMAALVVVCTIIVLIYLPFLNKNLMTFENTELYRFLSTLPKNVLIAGHPFEMDEIPLFSKRKVFVQHELSLPYYRNYYQKIRMRLNDFFKLYYAGSTDELRSLCERYEIDYIVVKKEHFTGHYINNKEFYKEPFNTYIQRIVKENIGSGFVLPHTPLENRIYEDKEFFVVKIDNI